MIKETMEFLSQYDPEVGTAIENEYHREQRNIELIASENIVSPAVMLAMGTCLTNKYAEGHIERFVRQVKRRRGCPSGAPQSACQSGLCRKPPDKSAEKAQA